MSDPIGFGSGFRRMSDTLECGKPYNLGGSGSGMDIVGN